MFNAYRDVARRGLTKINPHLVMYRGLKRTDKAKIFWINHRTNENFELPEDKDARSKFLKGLNALAEECGAEFISGSNHNEFDYIEMLEAEIQDRAGERTVNDLRLEFEKNDSTGQ